MINKENLNPLKIEFEAYQHSIDQAAIVATTDVSGDITYVNNLFCEISGYSREELLGSNHRILNSGVHGRDFFVQMWADISSGKVWKGEVCNKRRDGSLYWVYTTIVPFLAKNGKPYKYLSIRFDITDKKKIQEDVQHEKERTYQAEKMAALGALSAGLAHELGNPLGALRGRLEMLSQFAEQPADMDPKLIKDYSQRCIRIVDRISKIIHGLKTYSRNSEHDEMECIDLGELVEDILEFVRPRFKKLNCELRKVGLESKVKVNCRESEIGQVLLNTLSNALDAIADKPQKWIEIRLVKQAKTVQLYICDCGQSPDQSVQKKMFDPFYTTKSVGEGTGLGLSISKNIAEKHGGSLYLDPQSENTCFVLELPKVKVQR